MPRKLVSWFNHDGWETEMGTILIQRQGTVYRLVIRLSTGDPDVDELQVITMGSLAMIDDLARSIAIFANASNIADITANLED